MSVTVEGVLILLEAKSMMTIDFDKDVGQRVLGTDNMSVKSVMGRHVLISGFVESGEIRTGKWKGRYNTAESEAKAVSAGVLWNHLDMLTWSDVMDVISWCYVQWCDGLSRASSVSSRAARVRIAARLSEAARRIVRLRSHGEVGRISMCLFRWETLHDEMKTISSARRVATSYWIGRALLQGRSARVWNTLRTIVVYSGERLNCCDGLMRKLKPDEFA